MQIIGTIELVKTAGRRDEFVKKQLDTDYFLALNITNINGTPITTVASAFAALKPGFPSVKVGDEEVIGLFETHKIAEGMDDVCHLSLAYFGDFRVDRNTDNGLDQEKVDTTFEELHGKVISFEIEGCPFQVVTTSNQSSKINTNAKVAVAPAVGTGRDTILNILPSNVTQEQFAKILSPIFGEGFKLKNTENIPIPFHITIAQTDKLNAKLALVKEKSEKPAYSPSLSLGV